MQILLQRDVSRSRIDAAANGLTDPGAATCDSPDPATLLAAGLSDAQEGGPLFDDDIEWVQPGESAVSGTYHGKTEVMEYMGRLAEKSVTVKLIRLVAEGDTVAAVTEVSAGGETGEDADVFTIRNGKTVRGEMHGDTALLERVFGKKQLATG